MRRCRQCDVSIEGAHFNRMQCEPCQMKALQKPKGTMSPSQIRRATKMAGRYPRDEIARTLGVSLSNLKRSCPGVSFHFFNRYAANPALVERVCRYYERHGKRKTMERFPEVRVRSVVERYAHAPRQTRWTSEQIRQAAQMAGLVSIEEQAKFFSRPGARRGSIVSLWMKRFGVGGGNVNGLAWNIARHFVRPGCPKIKTTFWRRRTKSSNHPDRARIVVTWKDFSKHQKPSNPQWIKEAAEALARFQVWLHGTKQIRARVQRIVDKRGI